MPVIYVENNTTLVKLYLFIFSIFQVVYADICKNMSRLGSMVAMVGFSTVDIYTACMPSPILEFNNPNGREWLQNEAKKVCHAFN